MLSSGGKAVAAAMAWLTNSRQAAGSRRSARAWAATSSASSAPDATSLSDTNRSIAICSSSKDTRTKVVALAMSGR